MFEANLNQLREMIMMMPRTLILLTVGCLLIVAPFASAGNAEKTQEWIEVLRSNAPVSQKARACQRLGEFGTREAAPALASLLNDKILSVYARAGLERIPGPEAAAALRDALDETKGKFLIGVINSIAATRDDQAVGALAPLTRHDDPEVVRAALLALGRIANDESIPLVRQAMTTGPEAFRPDAAAACLLAAEQRLNDGEAKAAQALYDTVRKAQVPASYRIGATRGAIMARTTGRVPFLIQQLRSDDKAVRDVALLTVRSVPSDELAGALNAEIGRASSDLQIQLLTALKDCHNAQSIQIIKTKIESNDSEVRLTALRVLASIGGPNDAAAFLAAVKDHPGDEELAIALTTLERIRGEQVDERILDTLQRAEKAETRVALIRLLNRRRVSKATNELLRQAGDSEPSVSIAAFQALRSLASVEELPRLIDLAKNCSGESVRDAAVSAVLGACRNSEDTDQAGALVLNELKTATTSTEKESWIRVLTSLGYARALPTITAVLHEADPKLAQRTISHLSRWPDPAPMATLFDVLEETSNPSLRRQALMGILQLATTAADRGTATEAQLVTWLRRAGKAVASVQEKRSLISSLGRVKHIDSVRLSASYLNDPDVKIEAIHAILNAAEPLSKGPNHQAVAAVLEKISGVTDKHLRDRIARLQREIRSTAGTSN